MGASPHLSPRHWASYGANAGVYDGCETTSKSQSQDAALRAPPCDAATSLNTVDFPTLGAMRAEDVEPWHYRVEAENLAREANRIAPHDRTETRRLRNLAEQFNSIAKKHGWHPAALKSMRLREQCHDVRRASAGQPHPQPARQREGQAIHNWWKARA